VNVSQLTDRYRNSEAVGAIRNLCTPEKGLRLHLKGVTGSSVPVIASAAFSNTGPLHLIVLPEKEEAAYFFNDLENLLGEQEMPFHRKKVLFFPTTYRRPYEIEKTDNTNVLSRTEVMKRIGSRDGGSLVVTYPEALAEKVVSKAFLKKNTLKLTLGEMLSTDFVIDLLMEYNFERVDFVAEPGQFSVRGGIIDVFSFTNDRPYRIEFFGDNVESLRTFEPASQLSVDRLDHITITPNIQDRFLKEKRESFLNYIPRSSVLWLSDFALAIDKIDKEYEKAEKAYEGLSTELKHIPPAELFSTGPEFYIEVLQHNVVEFGPHAMLKEANIISCNMAPQPSFNKNFELFLNELTNNTSRQIENMILSDNPRQTERIQTILTDLRINHSVSESNVSWFVLNLSLHEGFIDRDQKLAC